ncbi:hypothetical protein Tco_0224156 [Tanacetum coccineum]
MTKSCKFKSASSENDCSKTRNDESSGKQSNTSGNESSRSKNEYSERSSFGNDTDIRPSYDTKPMDKVPYTTEYNVFAVEIQHTEQPKNMNDTSLMENIDSNTTPDSSNMCNNEIEADQYADHEDEHVVLTNLISNLKLDIDENKMIQKQLRKANTTLTHELNECKSTLEESNGIRDRCKSVLPDQEINLERCKKYKNCQLEKEEIKPKYKETLGLLA